MTAATSASELVESRAAGVFCRRVLSPVLVFGESTPTVLQLVATRKVRPATFNHLRVKPAHGKGAAAQMAAGAHAMSAEIDSWRTWAAGHPPLLQHVEALHGQVMVDVHHWRVNHAGAPDVGSPVVAAKALLDGLVDAGVLPNGDGPKVVRRETFWPYEVVGFDGLRVVITTLPSTSAEQDSARHHAPNRPNPRRLTRTPTGGNAP